MHTLGVALLRILSAIFFIGMAGSAVVVVISFIDDFRELFSDKE